MSEVENEKGKSGGVYLLVIIALALGLGYLAYKYSGVKKELNTCSNKNAELEADMNGMNDMMSGYVDNMSNDLRQDFKKMLSTYDALKAKDASQADSIDIQKQKIQNLLNQLNSNKRFTAQQLYSLRKENETLRSIMKGYVQQIDSLNTLNTKLSSDLETTTSELNVTKEERDQFKTEAEDNAAKVKKGSRLQAFSFHTTGLKMKLNNTTEETTKARNCVQIKSSFTLSENAIAPAGKRVVYMQIMNPEGRIMQARSDYTTVVDGVRLAYSDKKEVNYENQRLDLAIFLDLKGEEAVKGNYKVKIFCDEQVIGTDSFTLK